MLNLFSVRVTQVRLCVLNQLEIFSLYTGFNYDEKDKIADSPQNADDNDGNKKKDNDGDGIDGAGDNNKTNSTDLNNENDKDNTQIIYNTQIIDNTQIIVIIVGALVLFCFAGVIGVILYKRRVR